MRVGKGNHIQGTMNPPRKSKMWRERPTRTLHSTSDQTRGTKGEVENHSARPIVAEGRQSVEEKGPSVKLDLLCEHQGNAPTCPERPELSEILEKLL